MAKFFTSDQHFNHANVIRYSGRKFPHVDAMNEKLIQNWNETVSPDDEIYVIGDLFFGSSQKANSIISRLNGKKTLVFGNHDRDLRENETLLSYFESWHEYLEIGVPDPDASRGLQMITLCHFPMLTWNKIHYGAWMLHGHCHGNMPYPMKAKIHDVGVDNNNYKPVSYTEIKEIMSRKKYVALDHHRERD